MARARPLLEVCAGGEGWTLAVVTARNLQHEHVYQQLRQELSALLDEGRRRIALDLSAAEYIGNGLLGALISTLRNLRAVDGHLVLCCVPPPVAEVLELLRLDTLFDIRRERPDSPVVLPSPQEGAFIAGIREDPADAPRLIFADWLEERGLPADSARAEFIRSQCQAEGLPQGDARREPLQKREAALRRAHEAEWTRNLAGFLGRWEYRRGFIERVWMHGWSLLDHGEVVFSLEPVQVVVLGGMPLPVQVAQSPVLARLAELDASRCLVEEAAARALAESPHLRRVRLRLAGGRLSAEVRATLRERFGERLVLPGA